MLETLIELYFDLDLPKTLLLITDEIIGAGYIITESDNVIVRWGSYQEGIRILEVYKRAR